MVALRKPFSGFFSRSGGAVTARATTAAFKVGQKVYEKKGVTPELRELMRMYRENAKSE